MKREYYRGLEFHKYRIVIIIGVTILGLAMCKPHNPEQNNEQTTDTTDTTYTTDTTDTTYTTDTTELYLSSDTSLLADTTNQVSVK